ncbi:MAG: SURF1 family protein [Lysobacteraceae bacterium]|nr:MAG: SURF1 family protein [Xanthomonadaceae bacterium]
MGRPLGWGLALLFIALFSSLGYWQLDRARQKEAMLADADRVLADRVPVALASAADPARASRYEWAAGEGRFLPTPAILLDNQNLQGRPGLRVYRAFQPADTTAPLLVELGWLPVPGDRRLPRLEPVALSQVSGLLAPPPASGIATAVATPQADGSLLATRLDHALIAGALRQPLLATRVLRLDPTLKFGYARDLDILPNTLPPERHLGYAVQWFGLAVAVFVAAFVLSWRSRRRRAGVSREKMSP